MLKKTRLSEMDKTPNATELFQQYFSESSLLQPLQCNSVAAHAAHTTPARVADNEGPRDQRSPKGQGLVQKEGPPTYAILSRKLVLSRCTCFLKGFHKASTKVLLLSESFNESQLDFEGLSTNSACFRRAFGEPAFGELS